MTSRVEIFEIQSIICDLVDRNPIIVSGTEFVLKNEHDPFDDKNRVGATTNPRNLKFEEKMARRQIPDGAREVLDLKAPRPLLRSL